MPTLSRLSKHSNRSQHALVDPSAAQNAAAAAAGRGNGPPPAQGQPIRPQPPPQSQPQSPPQSRVQPAGQNPKHPLHPSQSGSLSPQDEDQLPPDHPALNPNAPPPPSALSSNPGFSSSESSFVDPRPAPPPISTQQQQQQQLPPGALDRNTGGGVPLPPPHQPFGVSPDTAGVDSPVFDNRRHPDFVEAAVNRSQSQRYSTYAALPHQQHLQQQQHQFRHHPAYSAGSTSLEDLPSSAGYLQQQPPPQQQLPPQAAQEKEKKSKRGFIRSLISGSNRSSSNSHQQHPQHPGQLPPQQLPGQGPQGQPLPPQQQNTYDNTQGLARRPSRRGSNTPAINTRVLQQPQDQFAQEHEWQGRGQYSVENSPLPDVGEIDEYHYQQDHRSEDPAFRESHSRASRNTTIRPVGDEPESPYDYEGDAYHSAVPQQQQQPPGPHQQAHPGLSGQHQQVPHPLHPGQGQVEVQQGQPQQVQQLEQSAPPSQPLEPHGQLHQHEQAHRHDQAPPYSQQTLQQLQQQQQQQLQQQQHFAAGKPPGASPYQQTGDPRDPRLVTSHTSAQPQPHPQQLQHQQLPPPSQHQNPETVSQVSLVSHESPVTDPDQRSTSQQSAQDSPAANYAAQLQDQVPTPNPPSAQLVSPPPQQSPMAPPSGAPATAPPSSRDNKAPPRGEPASAGAPPPGYRHSNSSTGALNIPPGQAGVRYDSPSMDQGRHSPQPGADAAEGDKAFKDLLTKYKNVKRLYFDGKSQIENLSGQVEQLQNAVANQRITQSRTALDDSEYATRFNRLNGALNNLSFNIRKDWRSLPPWVASYVSPDALKTGKQEMTAVGRAVIARWLVEEFFDKCFHPALDPALSARLKEIEMSIRGNSYTLNSQEEFSALTAKVVQWRMTTLDGLQKTLNSPEAAENRSALTDKATADLTKHLFQYLNTPPPPGVEGSTSMIIELAVGIAANLPLESRDVAITYPLPGDIVRPDIMEVEKTELPALEMDDDDSSDSDDDDKNKGRGEKTKSAVPKDTTRVRFAGFPAWEVRGRQVLMKAPVWTV